MPRLCSTSVSPLLLLALLLLVALLATLAHATDDVLMQAVSDALNAAANPGPPPAFSNIDLAGRGYDLLHGNPDSTYSADPGWRDSVFDLSSQGDAGRVTADGRYSMPFGTTVYPDVSCRSSVFSETITSESEYHKSLSYSVAVKASYKSPVTKASFKASRDYKQAKTSIGSMNTVFVKQSASCQMYRLEHWSNFPAPLSAQFIGMVKVGLHTSLDIRLLDDWAQAVIEQFGTHVPSILHLGSRFGVISEYAATDLQSSSSKDVKNAVSVSFKTLTAKASGSYSRDQSTSSDSASSELSSRESMFSIGSLPPADGDMNTWMSTSSNDLSPISISDLVPISTLLEPRRFPGKNAQKIGLLRVALERVWTNYCPSLGLSCDADDSAPPTACFGGFLQLNQSLADFKQGGVFQTTVQQWSTLHPVGNVFTHSTSCPSGFRAVPLSPSSGMTAWSASSQSAWLGMYICISLNPVCQSTVSFFSYRISSLDSTDYNSCMPNSVDSSLGCRCPRGSETVHIMRLPFRDYTFRAFYLCLPAAWNSPIAGALIKSSGSTPLNFALIDFSTNIRASPKCPPRYNSYLIGAHRYVHQDGATNCLRDVMTYLCMDPLNSLFNGLQMTSGDVVAQSSFQNNLVCNDSALKMAPDASSNYNYAYASSFNAPATGATFVLRVDSLNKCMRNWTLGECTYGFNAAAAELVNPVFAVDSVDGVKFNMRVNNSAVLDQYRYATLASNGSLIASTDNAPMWLRQRRLPTDYRFELTQANDATKVFSVQNGRIATANPDGPNEGDLLTLVMTGVVPPAGFVLRSRASSLCLTVNSTCANSATACAASLSVCTATRYQTLQPGSNNSLALLGSNSTMQLRTAEGSMSDLSFSSTSSNGTNSQRWFINYLPDVGAHELRSMSTSQPSRVLCVNDTDFDHRVPTTPSAGSGPDRSCLFDIVETKAVNPIFPPRFRIRPTSSTSDCVTANEFPELSLGFPNVLFRTVPCGQDPDNQIFVATPFQSMTYTMGLESAPDSAMQRVQYITTTTPKLPDVRAQLVRQSFDPSATGGFKGNSSEYDREIWFEPAIDRGVEGYRMYFGYAGYRAYKFAGGLLNVSGTTIPIVGFNLTSTSSFDTFVFEAVP